MATTGIIQGFETIQVVQNGAEHIQISQRSNDETQIIMFPVDRADALISAIKAAKKEINDAAKA